MGLFGPNPNKINPATGRKHSEDKRLYAIRDREVARMKKEHAELEMKIKQDKQQRAARSKSWWN